MVGYQFFNGSNILKHAVSNLKAFPKPSKQNLKKDTKYKRERERERQREREREKEKEQKERKREGYKEIKNL